MREFRWSCVFEVMEARFSVDGTKIRAVVKLAEKDPYKNWETWSGGRWEFTGTLPLSIDIKVGDLVTIGDNV